MEAEAADGDEPVALRLDHLKRLMLGGLRLSGLSIERCPQLHSLILVGDWLEGRVALQSCPQLRVLCIDNCNLTAAGNTWLDEELQHVQLLQELHLDSCRLGAVPAQIAGMTGLTELRMADNGIVELPSWLPPSLQWLDASHCVLGEVPAALESLTDLTHLKLTSQQDELRVSRPLLPLISSCAKLEKLAIGGTCWSPASLAHILELLHHLTAEGRELDFCYMLDADRRLAVAK
jgi:Leucine-rich repeat (LRR) protein